MKEEKELIIAIDVIIRQLNRQKSQLETSLSILNRLKNEYFLGGR